MPGRKHRAPLRVVAWGTSVLASALVAGLAPRTDLDVEQIEATLPAALAALRRKRAHAVVCDQASVPAAHVLTLLAMHPHLAIVIIDPNADHALTLRGRRHPMRTIDDLVTALSNGARERDDQAPTHIDMPT
jgi:hypothetical protein